MKKNIIGHTSSPVFFINSFLGKTYCQLAIQNSVQVTHSSARGIVSGSLAAYDDGLLHTLLGTPQHQKEGAFPYNGSQLF